MGYRDSQDSKHDRHCNLGGAGHSLYREGVRLLLVRIGVLGVKSQREYIDKCTSSASNWQIRARSGKIGREHGGELVGVVEGLH